MEFIDTSIIESSYDDNEASNNKRTWTKSEDDTLLKLVYKDGPGNWSTVAESLPRRTAKQCRERWHNHLDPNIENIEWTKEEDERLMTSQKEYGNQWSKIRRLFPGRTDNSIRNRFNMMMRALARKSKKEDKFKIKHVEKPKPSKSVVKFHVNSTSSPSRSASLSGYSTQEENSEHADDLNGNESNESCSHSTYDQYDGNHQQCFLNNLPMRLSHLSLDTADTTTQNSGTNSYLPSSSSTDDYINQTDLDWIYFGLDMIPETVPVDYNQPAVTVVHQQQQQVHYEPEPLREMPSLQHAPIPCVQSEEFFAFNKSLPSVEYERSSSPVQQLYACHQPPVMPQQHYVQETHVNGQNFPQTLPAYSAPAVIPSPPAAAVTSSTATATADAEMDMPWNQLDLDMVYFGLDFFDADSSSSDWCLGLDVDPSGGANTIL